MMGAPWLKTRKIMQNKLETKPKTKRKQINKYSSRDLRSFGGKQTKLMNLRFVVMERQAQRVEDE